LTSTEATSARPVWFGDDRRPAFGWFHWPASGLNRGGVVLCPPVGQDYIRAHYALRLLAEQLATAGFCVLRFDYDGTGDSAGTNDDPDRVPSWLTSVRQAVEVVRAAGAPSICLVGLRFGATLAAAVAAEDGDIDQVVLWDPCASGRSFLREQRAISTMTFGVPQSSPDGSVEIPGFQFDAATAQAINEVKFASLTAPIGRRVLLLTRADRPVDPSLLKPTLARDALSTEEAVDQPKFIDEYPPFQELPLKTTDRIVGWLAEQGMTRPPRPVNLPALAAPREVGCTSDGRKILETPVSVPPIGLFGILTKLEGISDQAEVPTAVFLNVAQQHHVGPSRLWVELARQWAAAGIPSLRLDLSGLGDSPGRRPGDDRWIYLKPESFDDVVDAVSYVTPDDPSNVVLVGLCSAGYQAIESAMVIKARGVVGVNPSITFVPPERHDGLPVDPRRRVLLPKDDVADVFRHGGRLGDLRTRFPDLAWRVRVLAAPGRRSGKWLNELARQGTDMLLACGDAEIRPIRSGLTPMELRRLQKSGHLRLEHIPGLQHDLFVADQRVVLTRMMSEYVISKFAHNTNGSQAV
jgi:pimeloyl-ACP methyl ester carboxylesterase